MNFIGFRTSNYATGLILIIRKFLSIELGQEGFGPWIYNCHDFMGGGCYSGTRTPDDIRIVFGCWGSDQVRTSSSALILPHHRWLKEPFHEGVGWHGVALSAHTSKDVRHLITISTNMMKLEPLEPS